MDVDEASFIEPWQPSRREEPPWLICWASEEHPDV